MLCVVLTCTNNGGAGNCQVGISLAGLRRFSFYLLTRLAHAVFDIHCFLYKYKVPRRADNPSSSSSTIFQFPLPTRPLTNSPLTLQLGPELFSTSKKNSYQNVWTYDHFNEL